MSTITRERAQEIFLGNGPEPTASEERELARIALASLEAEAVTNEIVIPEPATHRNINEICPPGVNQTLFASGWNASRKSGMNSGRIPPIVKGIDAECVGWNAYRAAMLQGADGTLTNEGTMPVNQFKPVADLYGLTSPTGSETSFTFDAVEARDFVDGGWSCQEYVELERFQEAITNHTEDKLAMVDHSGDSNNMVEPVTTDYKLPEGWVAVPVEPTQAMMNAWLSEVANWRGHAAGYRAMLAAAPQQEVKSGR